MGKDSQWTTLYLCAKFGDFSFSRVTCFIVRTNTLTPLNVLHRNSCRLEYLQWIITIVVVMAEMKPGLSLWPMTRPNPYIFDPVTWPVRFDRSSTSAKNSKLLVPNLQQHRIQNDTLTRLDQNRWPVTQFHFSVMGVTWYWYNLTDHSPPIGLPSQTRHCLVLNGSSALVFLHYHF